MRHVWILDGNGFPDGCSYLYRCEECGINAPFPAPSNVLHQQYMEMLGFHDDCILQQIAQLMES